MPTTLDTSSIKNLCPVRTPLAMLQLARLWLTNHFSSAVNITQTDLQGKVWLPGENTGILIEAAVRWRPTTTEHRPSIVIKRQAIQILHDTTASARLVGGAGSYANRRIHSKLCVGALSFFCISNEGGEAELLTDEVAGELLKFSSVVREKVDLIRCDVASIGEPRILEEAHQSFSTVIDLVIAYYQTWEITQDDSTTLAAIDLSLT